MTAIEVMVKYTFFWLDCKEFYLFTSKWLLAQEAEIFKTLEKKKWIEIVGIEFKKGQKVDVTV